MSSLTVRVNIDRQHDQPIHWIDNWQMSQGSPFTQLTSDPVNKVHMSEKTERAAFDLCDPSGLVSYCWMSKKKSPNQRRVSWI